VTDGGGEGVNEGFSGADPTCLYSSSYLFNALGLALVRSTFGVGQCLMTVATNEKVGDVADGGERLVGHGVKFILHADYGGTGYAYRSGQREETFITTLVRQR